MSTDPSRTLLPLVGDAPPSSGPPVQLLACLGLLTLLVACAWFFGPSIGYTLPNASGDRVSSQQLKYPQAPEIEGIAQWLGSEPMSIRDLRGQVVLLDFWTYTCVNCVRTVPQLREWHSKYRDEGLVILGIHTPEFDFEKDTTNVREAAQNLGITWPIAQDNDYVTWDNYENAFWPAKYLIDIRGRLRYHRVGEGGYASFEERIRELILERNGSVVDEPSGSAWEHLLDGAYEASPDRAVTRELYAGYDRGDFEREYYGRGYVDQHEYYAGPGRQLQLEAPDYLEPDFMYFQGAWTNAAQYAIHSSRSDDFEDYVAFVYSGRAVNAVLASVDGGPLKVQVRQDGRFLTPEELGSDVILGDDGESYLVVDRPRMYQVVANPAYVQRKPLQLRVGPEGLQVFAFTFGIYDRGP